MESCWSMKTCAYLLCLAALASNVSSQSPYFPPLTGSAWDTLSAVSLGWDTAKTDTLYRFLAEKNTRAFLVLKDGRIVLERYFGTFTADSTWYWASAGKTITAFAVGLAQQQGRLSIGDTSSKWLGSGRGGQ